MVSAAIVRVIARLIKNHGLSNGVKKAQRLGFKNKEIKGAVSNLSNKFTKGSSRQTFKQRKAGRKLYNEQARQYQDMTSGPSPREFRAMFARDRQRWQTGQTGPEHPVYGIPGIDTP